MADLTDFEPPEEEFDPADRVATLKEVNPDASGVLVVAREKWSGTHDAYHDGVLVIPRGKKRYTCTDHDWEDERPVIRTTTACCDSKETLRVEAVTDSLASQL